MPGPLDPVVNIPEKKSKTSRKANQKTWKIFDSFSSLFWPGANRPRLGPGNPFQIFFRSLPGRGLLTPEDGQRYPKAFLLTSTMCKLGALQKQVHLQGIFVKIEGLLNLKGAVMELLQNKRLVDFLSLAFYRTQFAHCRLQSFLGSLLLTIGAFVLTIVAFLTENWSFFAYSGKVRLISTLTHRCSNFEPFKSFLKQNISSRAPIKAHCCEIFLIFLRRKLAGNLQNFFGHTHTQERGLKIQGSFWAIFVRKLVTIKRCFRGFPSGGCKL